MNFSHETEDEKRALKDIKRAVGDNDYYLIAIAAVVSFFSVVMAL